MIMHLPPFLQHAAKAPCVKPTSSKPAPCTSHPGHVPQAGQYFVMAPLNMLEEVQDLREVEALMMQMVAESVVATGTQQGRREVDAAIKRIVRGLGAV